MARAFMAHKEKSSLQLKFELAAALYDYNQKN